MFEVPEAKRIKRSELFGNDGISSKHLCQSSSPAPVPATSFNFEYDFHPASSLAQPKETQAEGEDGTFEFRLFSSKPRDKDLETTVPSAMPQAVNRISIRSPTPPEGSSDGRFVNPYRPQSYYFTSANEPKEFKRLGLEYATVALDGKDVLDLAWKTKWPGTSLPWRVKHLNLVTEIAKSKQVSKSEPKVQPSKTTLITIDSSSSPSKRRTKPSKRRRMLLRRHISAHTSSAAAEAAKRTARNREKKVKRKAREKAKKATLGASGGEGEGIGVSGFAET